ncbi:MAG: hypothetical protein LBE17_12130, partial [Treponema sp.]|nr:hypothetical protein [Treponema sp.]
GAGFTPYSRLKRAALASTASFFFHAVIITSSGFLNKSNDISLFGKVQVYFCYTFLYVFHFSVNFSRKISGGIAPYLLCMSIGELPFPGQKSSIRDLPTFHADRAGTDRRAEFPVVGNDKDRFSQ